MMRAYERRLLVGIAIAWCFSHSIFAGNSTIHSVVVDKNNKVVVGGSVDTDDGLALLLIRYNVDGSLDTTFNASGANPGFVTTVIADASATINDIAIDAYNNIVVGGFAQFEQQVTPVVARYTEDGLLDATFSATGLTPDVDLSNADLITLNSAVTSITIDNNQNIIVVGNVLNGAERVMVVARFLPNGVLDATFNPDQNVIVVQGSNAIVTPGRVTAGILAIDISGINEQVNTVLIDRSNRILIGGVAFFGGASSLMLVRITEIGSLDGSFNPEGFLSPLGPGRLPPGVVITQVNPFDTENVSTIVGLSGVTPSALNDITLDSDNNIVAGGFYNLGGGTIGLIARYTDSGLLDAAFNPTGADPNNLQGVPPGGLFGFSFSMIANEIHKVAIDSSNRIMFTGRTFVDQIGSQILTGRVLSDGTLDTSFGGIYQEDITSGFVITPIITNELLQAQLTTDRANALVIDYGNNIVVAGHSNDSVSQNATLARYTINGALDTTFGNLFLEPGVIVTRVPIGPVVNPLLIGGPIEEDIYEPSIIAPEIASRIAYELQGFEAPTIDLPDYVSTNQLALPLDGTAQPNALVTVFLDSMPVETVVADFLGNWRAQLPELIEGKYDVEVIATDPISKLEVSSNKVRLAVDITQPKRPLITLPKNGQFINQEPVIIAGQAEPGLIVRLVLNDSPMPKPVTVDAAGRWYVELAELSDDIYQVYVEAKDAAGNISDQSEPVMFIKDTKPAIRPIIEQPFAEEVILKSTVVAQGTAKPFTEVKILLDGNQIGVAPVARDGRWVYEMAQLQAGNHILQVESQDPISKRIMRSVPHQFSVNVMVPVAVQVRGGSALEGQSSSVSQNDSGIQQDLGISTSIMGGGQHVLSGYAEPGSVVRLIIDNKFKAATRTTQDGMWYYYPRKDLKSGIHGVRVFVTKKDAHRPTEQQTVISVP